MLGIASEVSRRESFKEEISSAVQKALDEQVEGRVLQVLEAREKEKVEARKQKKDMKTAKKRRKKGPSDAAAAEEELFRLLPVPVLVVPAAEPAEVEAEAEGGMINSV